MKEELSISAIIYVPGRILTAICFPNLPIENEYPHMTLMLGNNWAAKLSNSVLIESCKRDERFKECYNSSKNGK